MARGWRCPATAACGSPVSSDPGVARSSDQPRSRQRPAQLRSHHSAASAASGSPAQSQSPRCSSASAATARSHGAQPSPEPQPRVQSASSAAPGATCPASASGAADACFQAGSSCPRSAPAAAVAASETAEPAGPTAGSRAQGQSLSPHVTGKIIHRARESPEGNASRPTPAAPPNHHQRARRFSLRPTGLRSSA